MTLPRHLRTLPVETDVIILGLRRDTKLNGEKGVVVSDFDGLRYGVKLTSGQVVRIPGDKVMPCEDRHFLKHVRRLLYEIVLFRNLYSAPHDNQFDDDNDTASISLLLGPHTSALHETTRAICLRRDGTLVAYGESGGVHAQLRAVDKRPEGVIRRLSVCDYDSVQDILVENSQPVDVLAVWCAAHKCTFWFLNRDYPRFHLSPKQMEDYTAPELCISVQMALMCVDQAEACLKTCIPECIDYHANKALLFFTSDNVRFRHIVAPGCCWDSRSFLVSRTVVPMPRFRLLCLPHVVWCIEGNVDLCITPPRVYPQAARLTCKGQSYEVKEWLCCGGDKAETLTTACNISLPCCDVRIEEDSFLATQLLLAKKMTMHCCQDQDRCHHPFLKTASFLVADMLDMVSKSTGDFALHVQHVLLVNEKVSIGSLVDPDMVQRVFECGQKSCSWIANAQALDDALRMKITNIDQTVTIMDGEVLHVSYRDEIAFHVASFAEDPVYAQARSLFTQTKHIRRESHMARLEKLQKKSAAVACSTSQAEATTEPLVTYTITPEALQESLARQQELIDQEEYDRYVASTKTKKKKDKKKRSAQKKATPDTESSIAAPVPTEAGAAEATAAAAAEATAAEAAAAVEAMAAAEATAAEAAAAAGSVVTKEGDEFTVVRRRDMAQRQISVLRGEREALAEENENLRQTLITRRSELTAMRAIVHDLDLRNSQDQKTVAAQTDTCAALKREKLKLEERITQMQQMVDTARQHAKEASRLEVEERQKAEQLTTSNHKQTEQMQSALSVILRMLADQLHHYARGHHMKLSPNVLSVHAILSDGYAAKNIIDIYRLFNDISPKSVLNMAVKASNGGLVMSADEVSICVYP